MKSDQSFTGYSDKADFQEALNNAVLNAEQKIGGTDIIVEWRLETIQGEKGGLIGSNDLEVKILARPQI